MRLLVVVLLVLLLLLLLVPLGMGAAMGCPLHASTCSSPVGTCVSVLSTIALLVSTMFVAPKETRAVLPTTLFTDPLDRPPRWR
jgi:hypothetical protein